MEEPPTSSASRGSTIEQTERMIDASLRIPTVKFLIEHLAKSGCSVGRDFFKAEKCGQSVSGGYQPGHGIEVCSNHVTLQDEVNQVIIHELIHAYDECRVANLDWSNCAHHACSEIRAGHLSGDCHFKRELLRGYFTLRGHEQECVKRRVLKSVNRNPSCSEEASKEAMEAVWDICYNDTKPFDRAM
ncbi:mitochondrial inner membrane protease ATP23 isoform X1 [Cryptomeria japonica]|uniref:mitochondrial inner membrane protease ATP23 isoform X1 n=1 Tax=Cryptomeria japonica TaxID=3369 RepID=UPI0025AD0C1D|nr:mitochondrial inner membrane protease ATP23 isoform X1 [Cryptomeria japonica]